MFTTTLSASGVFFKVIRGSSVHAAVSNQKSLNHESSSCMYQHSCQSIYVVFCYHLVLAQGHCTVISGPLQTLLLL